MKKPKFQLQIPFNPNNPFDKLGQSHNYLVGVLHENYDAEIEAISDLNERQAFIMEKTHDIFLDFYQDDIDVHFLDNVPGNPGLYSNIDFSTYATIFNDMTGLSAADRSTLIDLFNEITTLPIDDDIDVANALCTVIQFENNFLRNEDNQTNSIVLGTIAIAKYSLYYTQTEVEPPAFRIKWWHVLADAIGGTAGGLLAGPGGILAGAVAGTTIYEKCVD